MMPAYIYSYNVFSSFPSNIEHFWIEWSGGRDLLEFGRRAVEILNGNMTIIESTLWNTYGTKFHLVIENLRGRYKKDGDKKHIY